MHYFNYANSVLHAEEIPLPLVADKVGTPFYCYSAATLRRHFRVFSDAFDGLNTLVAYSVKSLSNVAVLKILANEGAGADVVSAGELMRVQRAGIPGEKIVFSGVGKTREEMALALQVGIHQFNVESVPELQALNDIAQACGKMAPVALRVNPDVAAGTHDKISTGRAEDKFGIAWSDAPDAFALAAGLPAIDVTGVDVHIGSQITDLAPFEDAFRKVASLVENLRRAGHAINRLDLGGGLGIPYQHDAPGEIPPHPGDYGTMIKKVAGALGLQLIFEPGRMISGNAGVLVSKVLFVKKGKESQFLILDAAMNDLIRPALYDAWHDLMPVKEPAAAEVTSPYDVVGPVCESGDTFAKARQLPPAAAGDLMAIMSAGAYGAVQSSEYNSRPLVPEVLVDGDRYSVIRKRPSPEEMLAREQIPDWL